MTKNQNAISLPGRMKAIPGSTFREHRDALTFLVSELARRGVSGRPVITKAGAYGDHKSYKGFVGHRPVRVLTTSDLQREFSELEDVLRNLTELSPQAHAVVDAGGTRIVRYSLGRHILVVSPIRIDPERSSIATEEFLWPYVGGSTEAAAIEMTMLRISSIDAVKIGFVVGQDPLLLGAIPSRTNPESSSRPFSISQERALQENF